MKKGIALDFAVKLIASAVFLVLVIYMLVLSGVFDLFKSQLFLLVCTFSAHFRSFFTVMIYTLAVRLSAILIVVLIISSMGSYAVQKGALSSIMGKEAVLGRATVSVLKGIKYLRITTLLKLGGIPGLGGLIVYIMISGIMARIPIICPVSNINVGFQDDFATPQEFVEIFSGRTMDCYSMFGSGDLDSLMGLPDNPRICYSLEVHIGQQLSMTEIYQNILGEGDVPWGLGTPPEMKLHLVCDNKYFGNNPSHWGNCNVSSSRIYIMFVDVNPLSEQFSILFSPYSSSLGGGFSIGGQWATKGIDGVGQFQTSEDIVVWVVEDI